MTRVEAKQIDALFDAPPPAAAAPAVSAAPPVVGTPTGCGEPAAPTIRIDQFNAVELRVARITRRSGSRARADFSGWRWMLAKAVRGRSSRVSRRCIHPNS